MFGELIFKICEIGLGIDVFTFPSRLVMKSLVRWGGDCERERSRALPRLEESEPLRELM